MGGGRIIVLRGWRAYALGAALLAVVLLVLLTAGVILLASLAVAALGVVAYGALRALGLVRPARRMQGSDRIIEGDYRVVERRLPDTPPEPRA